MGTFRSNFGMDNSFDNFKGAFANKFSTGLKLGTQSVLEPAQIKGAVAQPADG